MSLEEEVKNDELVLTEWSQKRIMIEELLTVTVELRTYCEQSSVINDYESYFNAFAVRLMLKLVAFI